ncbi:MAG: carbon-nitrogen hydrolase family protein [Aquimonas sp.]|nr:carbon-nitrogen hydrolase family protein [Aquimonas sp.]
MRVAACKYPLETLSGFAAFAEKQARLLQDVARQGAQVAVLPEYLALEIAGGFDPTTRTDLGLSVQAMQSCFPDWALCSQNLADRLGLWIQAGTFLLAQEEGRYRNRAFLFRPHAVPLWQDKLQLTGFEKQSGLLQAGNSLQVFDLLGQRSGMAVCYDSEFPLPVRAQCEAGARVLLVPSCTDTAAGATRVRIGCQARALENRIFVACAVTSGELPWSPALDSNTGEAAIYAPMDIGLPADGVLASTTEGQLWAIAELELSALTDPNRPAQVANDRDWMAQQMPLIKRARLV